MLGIIAYLVDICLTKQLHIGKNFVYVVQLFNLIRIDMLTGPLKDLKKPSFSGHETFPLRYGWLTKMMDYFDPEQTKETLIKKSKYFFSTGEKITNLMADFGVGKNMVSSIRFWADKTNIIDTDTRSGMQLSSFGKLIKEFDPYLNFVPTLWLIHWKLCSNINQTTTFYYTFNYFTSLEITKDQLFKSLMQLKKDQEWVGSADQSIKRDIDVLFRTYTLSKNKNNEIAEDSFECPLTELGIIQPTHLPQVYQFVVGEKSTLDNYVFAHALNDFWNEHYKDSPTLGIDKVTYDIGSPGKVFKIDELSISHRLSELEYLTKGYFKWTETAGLHQILRDPSVKFDSIAFLKQTYKNIMKLSKVA